MLRIIVNNASGAAKSYYAQGLSKNDYYTKEKDTEIVGLWGGKGSELLSLNGTVTQDTFYQLCDNINPLKGDKLTGRNNENRRVGYDINFHAPKSLSLIYSITKDEQILSAFRDAVKDTMQEIEKDMQARIRIGGSNENRETGNLVYGEFIHTTSRPVNGVPDPHLHAHCFTFNSTYDQVENKWKAGEFGRIKKDAAYFEAYFHSNLSSKIKEVGYQVEANKKGWEIAGIERETMKKFSRRTTEIEELAKEKGIRDAKQKDQLGAKTRKSKDKSLSENDLIKTWLSNLTDAEKTTVLKAKQHGLPENVSEHPAKYVEQAVEHLLERRSVASEREVLREALKKSYGACKPEQIVKAYNGEELLKAKGKDETLLTTKEAVNEERKLIRLATESKGRYAPIAKDYTIGNKELNTEQQNAVKHALTSKNQVIIIEGGAGTGKTTLMKELKTAINEAGKKIIPLAPSAEASRGVLESEGFKGAETVVQLLLNPKLQEKVKNNVIWVDEAGLLGNKAMNGILEIAKQQNARVILKGDTRQHNSVERGDALRLIMEKSKIKAARVNEIQRQRNHADYKSVVKNISESKFDKAFTGLERINAIHEITDNKQRYSLIAEDYVKTAKTRQSVLVVAPTHFEGEQVTREIREKLKAEKQLGKQERIFTVQKNLSPTEAEKKDARYYNAGMSIQFHQNAKGFQRGAVYDVTGKDGKGNIIVSNGTETKALPLLEARKFSIYETRQVQLAKGDIIRISQNGFSLNRKRLNNGNVLKVKGFDNDGNIIANTGNQDVTLGKDHRNFGYGYCSTSHSSQGKTVDKVIISQSSVSHAAASKEQFYVSVSRGKSDISIYTDDKAGLRQAVTSSSQRMSAIEILNQKTASKQNNKLNAQKILVGRLTELSRAWYQRTIQTINKTIRK